MALAGGRLIGPGGAAGAVDGGGVDRRAIRARHTGAVEGNPSVVRWPCAITMGFGQFGARWQRAVHADSFGYGAH